MKPTKMIFRILCIALALALVATVTCGCDETKDTASQSSVASSSQTVSSIQEEPKYGETTVDYLNKTRILGRFIPTTGGKGLFLSWTNSGFEFTFEGTAAYLKMMTVAGASGSTLIGVFVDGEKTHSNCFGVDTNGLKTYPLIENLPEGKHTVKVLKLSEARYNTLVINQLGIMGKNIAPTHAKERIIEYLGDSITCGHGSGASPEKATVHELNTLEEDGSLTYCHLTSEHFNADERFVSYSGIGASFDADGTTLPMCDLYQYTAGVQQKSKDNDEKEKWLDSKYYTPADAVVINLGTNESDERVGSAANFERDYVKLLKSIRKINPKAAIICTQGTMGAGRAQNIQNAIATFQQQTGDKNVHFFLFSLTISASNGTMACEHPSAKAHAMMADELIAQMEQILGWK